MTEPTDLDAALLAKGIDYRTVPDGIIVIDRTDGGRIAVGEDHTEPGDWWNFTVYSVDEAILTTDGADSATTVVDMIARYLA